MNSAKITARDLKAALALASKVIERRNTIPILGNIMMTARAGVLAIDATDLDVEISAQIPLIDGDGVDVSFATVSLGAAVDALKAAKPDQIVTIENHAAESPDGAPVVSIAFGPVALRLQTLPREDFPSFSALPIESPSFNMNAAEFSGLVTAPAFAMSKEETRYYLNGVYLHPVQVTKAGAYKLRAVATDGHRLCIETADAPDGAAAMPGIILPRKTVNLIAPALKKSAAVCVTVSAVRVVIQSERVRIVSKLIDGTFPDYERVCPHNPPRLASFDARALADNVKALMAVSADRSRSIRFSFNGRLVGQVNNPESGSASFEQALKSHSVKGVDGEPAEMQIGFNGEYVNAALAAFDYADGVQIGMSDAQSPVEFTAPGTARRVVVMPLRV